MFSQKKLAMGLEAHLGWEGKTRIMVKKKSKDGLPVGFDERREGKQMSTFMIKTQLGF